MADIRVVIGWVDQSNFQKLGLPGNDPFCGEIDDERG
jgi:hypothetical protein